MENNQSRVVWITGASAGIGSAIAEKFASCGDIVIASARSEGKLKDLSGRISSAGGKCDTIKCDVQSKSSVLEAVKYILESKHRIDILINNAGVTYFKDFSSTSVEEFDHIMNTNLRGAFLTTKAVLPAMIQNKKGLIINILSYAVKKIYRDSSAYTASKAGTEAMMNVLRAEIRRQGIHVVNVYPGAVSTPMWPTSQREKYSDRMIAAPEIAEMVHQVSIQPSSLMVEEIIIRPQSGDIPE